MDKYTPEGSKNFKCTLNQCQLEVEMDQYEEQLKFRITNLKNRNIYQSILDESTLPQDLKTFLSNIKTIYQYIEVNRSDSQKIIVQETGRIHLVFMLSFGPNSQIKKQIIIETDLKEVGSVQGSNIKENFDKLREEIIQINKKYQQQRKKLKQIIVSIQKVNQRLVIQSEALKLENIQFKKKFQLVEQKLISLEILLKDLYIKFQVLKQQNQELQKKIKQTRLFSIDSPNMNNDPHFNKEINQMKKSSKKQKQKKGEQSMIKKLKSLQDQRDQQKKKFQDILAQKQRRFSQKFGSIQINSSESGQQKGSDVQSLKSYLKDSQIQQLKNAVSPVDNVLNSQPVKTYTIHSDIKPSRQSMSNQTIRKVGQNGKYYCGGKLCPDQNCTTCKGFCGPAPGQNCTDCMRLDILRRGLKKGFLVNGNGQVCWLQNDSFCCGMINDNRASNCGLNQKYCKQCQNLTKVYAHRYKSLM